MSLYKKTLFFLCMIFFLLTLILYSTSRFLLLRSFHDLENRYALQNTERLRAAIDERLNYLHTVLADWAEWDDTRVFIRTGYPAYTRSNLTESTFTQLKLNLVLFASPEGKIQHSEAFDLEAGHEVPLPVSLRDHLKPGSLLLQPRMDGISGMLLLPEGPLLIASHPILTSRGEGPPAGVMVMARFLDAREIGDISRLIQHQVTITGLQNGSFPPKEIRSRLLKSPFMVVQPRSRDIVSGYLLIRDIYGIPTMVAQVDMVRDIFTYGKKSLSHLFIWLVLIGLVSGGLTLLIVERGILKRLSRLAREVQGIGNRGDVSGRLTVEGKDEIAALALEMNHMMGSLESAQEALRVSEVRMRAQYRGLPISTGTWRRTGEDFEFIDYNEAAVAMTRGNISQIIGMNTSVLFRGRPALTEAFERCWRERTKVVLEILDKPLSMESERFFRYSLNFVPPDLILLHIEDITERKQAEETLLSMQRKLRSLASKLSLAEERERRRVATHLHDDIGHVLALCQFRLEALQEKVPAGIGAELEEIREAVVAAINETRSLTFQLCPPVLYELGLAAALDWLGEQTFRKHGLIVKVSEEGGPERIETELRALLFQSARELLFNVVKHAAAKHVTITLRSGDNHVLVMVEDDGRGFDVSGMDAPDDEAGGFGLFSIRERLAYIGGSLDIRSAAGEGARVTLTAPLQKKRGAKHEVTRG